MRLWHKSLIPYLPRQQLLGQWRECCLIAKNITEKGTPNHILVNRIMDYPIGYFWDYGYLVCKNIRNRGYKCNFGKFDPWFRFYKPLNLPIDIDNELFLNWHNDRYLTQCMFNLEEKHDCQGITDDEWNVLLKGYKEITGKDWENGSK